MGLNIWDLLLPREVAFFKYMKDQADVLHQACTALKGLISHLHELDEESLHMQAANIKDLELLGDRIERFIIQELDKTFITPIDREDIHNIAVRIDRALDLVNDTSQKIEIYHVRKVSPNVVRYTGIMVDISVELKRLIAGLEKKDNRHATIKRMHQLENQADDLFHVSMAELFTTKDVVNIIKLKEIIEHCEAVVNSIDHIAKVVRGVMVTQG